MKKIKSKNIVRTIILLTLLLSGSSIFASSIELTESEKEYINSRAPIIAASVDGGAPLHFINSKGETDGIAVKTIDRISSLTGLEFECNLYSTIDEAYNSNADILFGLSPSYTRDYVTLSKPYMKTKTILFMNSKLSADDLEGEVFAALKGGTLPDNISDENVSYYNTREEAINAVEKGDAGYGYGNEYSVAYYRIKNGYENIITIPKIVEVREYSIGLMSEDKILLSIINKAIDAIDEETMSELIIDVASNIERNITLPMVFKSYGLTIFTIIIIVLLILIFITKSNIQAKKALSLQNKRYELLYHISNECILEYNVKSDKMTLSDRCEALFESKEQVADLEKVLKNVVLPDKANNNVEIMDLQLTNGQKKTIKVAKSEIFDHKGEKQYIIGKIIDISEEVAEKQELINKAEIDGLTNIYNSATTKRLINKMIKTTKTKDAFLLIDCDKFKLINDNFGHLEGDAALKNVSSVLTNNFYNTDIIGRIGGDEFCVYMKDIPSIDFVINKSEKLISQIRSMSSAYDFTFSIGIKILEDEKTYEDLFNNADIALYKAKKVGGATVRYF